MDTAFINDKLAPSKRRMQALIFMLLFAGAFLIMHGIYEEKLSKAKELTKIEYRFIPRTYYEEQMDSSNLDLKTKDMFNHDDPWYGIDTLDLPLRSKGVGINTPTRT